VVGVRGRLFGSFAVIIMLVACAVGVGLWGVQSLHQQGRVVAEQTTPYLTHLSDAPLAAATYEPKDSILINVRNHGVTGDGVTDDTAAINAVSTAKPGKTIWFPAGTYMVDASTTGTGIALNQPNTHLMLDPGATIKVITNSATSYAAIAVSAADCSIVGGTILGDGPAHTGTRGEWGHLISVVAGGDRLHVIGTTVKNAWGDGIAVTGGVADVSLIDVVADDNRRQGLSVIGAVRPRILGGVYKNTGLTKYTAPGSGIDIEPNPSSGINVTDATVTGVTLYNNKGAGLQIVRATGQTTTATVTNCHSVGNGAGGTASGFRFAGAAGTMLVKVTGCSSVRVIS